MAHTAPEGVGVEDPATQKNPAAHAPLQPLVDSPGALPYRPAGHWPVQALDVWPLEAP